MLSAFYEEMNRNVVIYNQASSENVYNPANGQYCITPSAGLSISGVAYYEGSSATALVDDRFKEKISGVFIGRYDQFTSLIDQDKIVMETSRSFEVVHKDDIMNLHEVLVVAVKEITWA